MRLARLLRYRGAGVLLVRSRGHEAAGVRLVLLARRKSGWWSIPGGGAHGGESFRDAALREATEEVGALPRDLEELGARSFEPLYRWVTFVLLTRDDAWEVDTRARDFFREFDAWGWFLARALPPRAHPLARWVVERYVVGRG